MVFNIPMATMTYTADAVRAELARKRKTRAELARAMEMTPYTLGRRLNGSVAFTIPEVVAVSVYLDVPLSTFIPPDDPSALSA